MADCYVYALLREDGTPFYVGKGRAERWLAHETACRPGRSHKDNIIAAMKARGLAVPKHKIAEGLTDQEALALEVQLIAAIGRTCDGGPLTNLTAGGDGLCNPSPEVRAKIADATRRALTGRTRPAEVVEKIAAALRGRVGKRHTDESRARIGAALRGKPHASGMTGKTHSPETRERMRQAALGRVISAEQRAAISAAQTGRGHSAETRLRMGDGQRAAWVKRKERANG